MLLSFHLPFRTPPSGILRLVPAGKAGQPRMLHVLSGSCGCSNKIMRHLADRGVWPGIDEQILMIDSASRSDYLPDSPALLRFLENHGFAVTHLAADRLPKESGLRGVPLLMATLPGGQVKYLGGYGPAGDQDTRLLKVGLNRMNGPRLRAEPLFGCAVSRALQHETDPLRLKYQPE